jgi:hypothetical protein
MFDNSDFHENLDFKDSLDFIDHQYHINLFLINDDIEQIKYTSLNDL